MNSDSSIMEDPKARLRYLTIDWNRCIHVNGTIDEELLSRVTPKILSLRQESNDPITVDINSPGGSPAVV